MSKWIERAVVEKYLVDGICSKHVAHPVVEASFPDKILA
jgi:hypothetical protein